MKVLSETCNKRKWSGFLIHAIIATGIASAADKISFKGEFELFGGYESNIFRNSHDMEYPPSLGGNSYDPVLGDAAIGSAIKSKTTLNLNSINRLSGTIKADYQAFPHNRNGNQGQAIGEIEYRLKPGDLWNFRLPVSYGIIRKLGVDESVAETNIYQYWAFDAEPEVQISPSSGIDIQGKYKLSLRDYRNDDTIPSLDNLQSEITLSVEPHFGRNLSNSIGLELAYLFKKYKELGSYDSAGSLHSTPLRSYHYATVELSFKHDFGPVTWKIAYRPRYRNDPFQDYYTYWENRISSRINARFKTHTAIVLDGAWRYRHYPVHPAAQPGNEPDPDLVIHYLEINASAEQPIGKHSTFFIEYDQALRNTNTGVLYFHTYRDYNDNLIKTGARFSW